MDAPSTAEPPGSDDDPAVLAESADGAVRALGGYPGANADDVRFDDGTLRLSQDYRDTGSEWTFYWSVGVESDVERAVTVELDDELVGRFGPAASHDRREWAWLGADAAPDRRTVHLDLAAGERVFLAFSFPYTLADLEAFWGGVDHPATTRERLATSPGGRDVPLLQLGDPGADEHVVLAARHHACETPGSYALEGTVRALLDADALDGRCVHVVPFVDVDGVQRGDQGKERLPHDHNRDYAPGNALLDDVAPIYPATAAIQEHVRGLDGDLALAVDYHAPFKWGSEQFGALHDRPFLAGDPADVSAPERRFASLLDAETDAGDALDFHAGDDDGFGEPGGRSGGCSFAAFCERQGATPSLTLEVPYVGTPENRVTPASCGGLGRAVGRAVVDLLG